MASTPTVITADELPEGCNNAPDVIVNVESIAGGLAATDLCTPDGLAVFICKLIDGEDVTFVPHVLDPDTGVMTPYSGPTETCPPVALPDRQDACFDWCMSGSVWIDRTTKEIDCWVYLDPATGETVSGDGPTPDGLHLSLTGCPSPVKLQQSVWQRVEGECPTLLPSVTLLCFGPKVLRLVDGALVDADSVLEPGQFYTDTDVNFVQTCCFPCPVVKATEYDVDSFAFLEVYAPIADCDEPGFEPTVVTWGDTEYTIEPGGCWPHPFVECEQNAKPVTITGPHSQFVWGYENEEVC